MNDPRDRIARINNDHRNGHITNQQRHTLIRKELQWHSNNSHQQQRH